MPKVKVEVLPKPNGRKYEPWMCDTIVEVAEQGGHIAQMCKAIGIRSTDTYYRWQEEYPEFKEACKAAKLASLAYWEAVTLGHALGKIKGNFNAVSTILSNKFRDEYAGPTRSGTEINIGSINSIEHLDATELNAKLEAKLKQIRALEHGLEEDSET